MGWRDPRPGDWGGDFALQFPFTSCQGWGAWVALSLAALWTGRNHFRAYFQRALHGDPAGVDSKEALNARLAAGGFLVGFLALCIFVWTSGASLWIPIAFLAIYFLIMVAVTRMRAEVAVLSTDLGVVQPQTILPALIGTRNMLPADMAHIGMLSWFNMDYRSALMPHQLEGLVGMKQARGRMQPLVWAILLASVVTIVSATLWDMQMYYVNGAATAQVVSWRNEFAIMPWHNMDNWLHSPTNPNPGALVAMMMGFCMTLLLSALRTRFIDFPFHPGAYVLNTSHANDYFWCDMLCAWIIKSCILRYGGRRLYQAALPFFLGLILGDFVTGAAWCLVGTIGHLVLFRTFPV